MQAAFLRASLFLLLAAVLLLARYFVLHLLTARESAARVLGSVARPAGGGPGSGAWRAGAGAGGGAGAPAGAMTLNVLAAVVGCVCPPWPAPEGTVVARSA